MSSSVSMPLLMRKRAIFTMSRPHIRERQTSILTNAIAWCLFSSEDDSEEINISQEDADKCRAIAERCVADLEEDEKERMEQSNLVRRARNELELLGEEQDVIDWY